VTTERRRVYRLFVHAIPSEKAKIASATPYRVNLAAAELLAGLPRLPSLCSGHKYRQGH
jgi:hypothetical protein